MNILQSSKTLNDLELEEGMPFRKTGQFLMPNTVNSFPDQAGYNIYPVFNLGDGRIHTIIAHWLNGS